MDMPFESSRGRLLVMAALIAALVILPLVLKTPEAVPASWGPSLAPLNRAFDARWKQRFLELHIHSVETACMTAIDPQVCYVARDSRGKVLGAFRLPHDPVPSFENYAPPKIDFHFVRNGVSFEVHSPLLQSVVAPADAERILDEALSGLTQAVETRNTNSRSWTVNPDETGMCVRPPEPAPEPADASSAKTP